MNAYGIPFTNRTKTTGADAEDASKQASQFLAFAALCNQFGVAKFVRGVDYTSNCCAFWIDVDDALQFTDVGGALDWAADKTLAQFVLFGTSNVKGGLDDAKNS